MIGDTMETDILGGVQLGYHTVLVLSGGTAPDDLARYAYRPDVVVASLAELAELLEESDWRPPWRTPSVDVALQEDGEDHPDRLAAYSAAYRTFPPTIV
jgi:NagD protein